MQFSAVIEEAGLDFTLVSGGPEQRYILEAMSGGVASVDYDGDSERGSMKC